MYQKIFLVILGCFLLLFNFVNSEVNGNQYGYIPKCYGITKPVYVTPEAFDQSTYVLLQVHEPATEHQAGYVHRRRYIYSRAAYAIGNDPIVDFKKKKTMLFMDGYMDSGHQLTARFLMGDWGAMGYNVISLDAQRLYSFVFVATARNSYAVANHTAQLLKDLMPYGLRAEDLELIGISLGGQVVSLVAKYFYKFTGLKPKKIWSMDPGGPCFRSMPPEHRLTHTDAHFVQVVHTGIDGFGTADALGHVDFYVNGGEWQHFLIPHQPWAEELISHVISAVYLYSSLLNDRDKYVGIKCVNVQQAREHKCYENKYPYETNIMGFKADKSKPGIYYIPVRALPPLYPEEGWMEKKVVYPLIYNDALSNVEHYVLKMSVNGPDYNIPIQDIIGKSFILKYFDYKP